MSEPVRVGLLSDTHLSSLSGELLKICQTQFRDVELILHAGDVVAPLVLEELEAHGFRVLAVRGNMDYHSGLGHLPETRVVEVGAVTVGICHGGGSCAGSRLRILERFGDPAPDLIVYGHTHEPDDTVEAGVRFVNPGSPTDRRFAEYRSLGRLTVRGEKVEVELIRV